MLEQVYLPPPPSIPEPRLDAQEPSSVIRPHPQKNTKNWLTWTRGEKLAILSRKLIILLGMAPLI